MQSVRWEIYTDAFKIYLEIFPRQAVYGVKI